MCECYYCIVSSRISMIMERLVMNPNSKRRAAGPGALFLGRHIIYIYIYIYIYTHIYTHIYIYICIYIYMHTYIGMYICIYIYIYVCVRMCVCIYIYIYIYTHMYMCAHIWGVIAFSCQRSLTRHDLSGSLS